MDVCARVSVCDGGRARALVQKKKTDETGVNEPSYVVRRRSRL